MIGSEGQQVGIVAAPEALSMARTEQLDLVEVAPQSVPPVCRIMDYTKFKYDQAKKEREAKKKQRVMHLKELRLNPKIEAHDYQVKLKHLEKFLKHHDKVKVRMTFRGREMAHMELGRVILDRMVNDAAEYGELEKPAVQEGRNIILVFKPKA
ncbi:MAG: translation initiation factor IF-3 [Candidatus Omnitrophica bacterium]|nr:translation initiation factor IF-3 [Candidatus Omnitrophota bacterium]